MNQPAHKTALPNRTQTMRFWGSLFTGERRLKLTGDNRLLDVNADFMATYTVLNEPTLYPSSYMVLNNKGYTKHYYAGTERVAARLGGGGLNALQHVIAIDDDLQWKADKLFKQSLEQVNYRVLDENDLDCIMHNEYARAEFGKWIEGIPYHVRADVQTEYWQFKEMVNSMLDDPNNGHEKEVYFYHSDHLGSASWITDADGKPIQHLQYLPYGEPYVNQRISGYNERFTFTGKERDEETGYGYFGARYMDHELTAMWLSVDPLADKYPSISPYAYCAWNPIKLVDPDGKDWYKTEDGSIKYTTQYNSSMGKNLGKTYNDGRYYYSLFGDKIRNKVKNEKGEWVINPKKEITKNIDDAMMSYARYAKETDEFAHAKKDVYTLQNEPVHSKTDFTTSIPFDGGWGTTNNNWHYPNEMGVYAGIADIYYFVNGGNMKAIFDKWEPSTTIKGSDAPVSRNSEGKPLPVYLTFSNSTGIILGLNFKTVSRINSFKSKFYELYPEIKPKK